MYIQFSNHPNRPFYRYGGHIELFVLGVIRRECLSSILMEAHKEPFFNVEYE